MRIHSFSDLSCALPFLIPLLAQLFSAREHVLGLLTKMSAINQVQCYFKPWLTFLPVHISDPSRKWEPWSVHRVYCASDLLPFFSFATLPSSSRTVDFLVSFVSGCLASLLFKHLVHLLQRCACGTVWDHCDLNFLSLWLKPDQWKITLFLSVCFQFLLRGSVLISY